MPCLLPALRRAAARACLAGLTAGCLAVLPASAQEAAPDPAAPGPSTEVQLPAITVATVAQATLRDRVVATGEIAPVETVQVQPLIEGQPIEALLADVGDRVAAGQPLARLSDASLTLAKGRLVASRAAAAAAIAQAEAQRIEAQSSADEAQRVRRRTEDLRRDGTASQAALDQAVAQAEASQARVTAAEQGRLAAEAQLQEAEAQIADIDLQLRRTLIVAPVAGLVTARNAQVGAIATAAAGPMFTLIRDGALELRADVAEQDLLRLAEGQAVTLRPVGLAEPLAGHVRLVEPSVDSATRLGRVRIAVDQPERVRPGLFAEAEILVAERQALAVPAAAIRRDDGQNGTGGQDTVLRVAATGEVERVEVTTGIRDGALVEVTGRLFAGDTVVARAGAFVRPGERVSPVPAPATN
ncbi:efflux RND transporter periplasmic adaptor subunit [Frigidibacter oleivorans]|uniref:efflux RND transporter periplasmic adaptor subunit n=1 Tax=Frigidibacter oleivorans TaxID=2487129 RepID=UPI000F8E86D2|nr:efflux RND transporter periplasmic adaptor subunit [Frigidibacter oleivorans]